MFKNGLGALHHERHASGLRYALYRSLLVIENHFIEFENLARIFAHYFGSVEGNQFGLRGREVDCRGK